MLYLKGKNAVLNFIIEQVAELNLDVLSNKNLHSIESNQTKYVVNMKKFHLIKLTHVGVTYLVYVLLIKKFNV